VIVHDLNVLGSRRGPAETDAPLVVNTDTVLTLSGIQIIDMSVRTDPVPRGFYASDADVMPDGHLALLTNGHHQSKPDTSAASIVIALDLSDRLGHHTRLAD